MSLDAAPVVAHVVRNGFVESVHHGLAVVTDAASAVVRAVGDPTTPVFPRSSLKPVQAVGMLRRGGFMALVGLPPGDFPLPIFDIVLQRITVRGSIVGTRNDLREALAFAGAGKVASHFSWDRLENINAIFDSMRAGKIDGRIVLEI